METKQKIKIAAVKAVNDAFNDDRDLMKLMKKDLSNQNQ